MEWLTRPLFSVGATQVSTVKLAQFAIVLVLVVVLARVIGRTVGSRLLSRTGLDRGLQYAIGRIIYYALLVIGFMIALQTSGIEVGSLTVILGALGVGIGFGLQNVVNNFVGGLILLIERPIKVGDRVEVGGTGGVVDRIGGRSTTIVTNDNISIIVPNSQFVTERIVNWSHGNPNVRLRLRVGVAYGSDLELVRATLIEVAQAHRAVLAHPASDVFFVEFADSALQLELAVWTREMALNPRRLRSDLNFAIDAAFRRAGITIPFPQRDVHLRSEHEERPPEPGDGSDRD